jgi:hypothetical protein
MLFLPLLLTAGNPMAGILAGPELLPAGHGLGSNCSECFLSRGLSVKLRGWFVKEWLLFHVGVCSILKNLYQFTEKSKNGKTSFVRN